MERDTPNYNHAEVITVQLYLIIYVLSMAVAENYKECLRRKKFMSLHLNIMISIVRVGHTSFTLKTSATNCGFQMIHYFLQE